jgi:hypothetical protein
MILRMDGSPPNSISTRDAVVDLAGAVGGLTAAMVSLQTAVIALQTATTGERGGERQDREVALEQSQLELMRSSELANAAFRDVLRLLEGLGQGRG